LRTSVFETGLGVLNSDPALFWPKRSGLKTPAGLLPPFFGPCVGFSSDAFRNLRFSVPSIGFSAYALRLGLPHISPKTEVLHPNDPKNDARETAEDVSC
jgi:hypothetical protein